jgi:hypothetical protein
MSVILDALHKARGDKSGGDNQSRTVARVVEAQRVSADLNAPPKLAPSRMWIPLAIVFGAILMLVLVAGILYFLFVRLQQLDARDKMIPAPAAVTIVATPAVAPAPAIVPPLPTPLPLQDLPVAGKVATEPMVTFSDPGTAKPAVAPEKLFVLGSIVCENNDCLALINGHTAHVGDVMKGYKITAIGPSSVTLTSPSGEAVNLSLFD